MNDEELRRRFAELKRADAERAPPFRTTRPPSRVNLLYAAIPALAAAAVLIVWCGAQTTASAPPATALAPAPSPPPPPRVETAAALPLDFLLETAPTRVRLDADPIEGLRP
ncbi:MAG: hypothetical protein KIT84_30415 [Labilithrix sp.]|nr:hypothetical protein [Labilithrix sp.]MCW5815380.1 hypothetical protein [Labilithrix sp.]